MCGRYASTRDPAKLAAEFDAADATGEHAVSEDYNVAPTKPVLSIANRHGERGVHVMRWGLVPKWAKSPAVGSRMINAKAETVTTKPAFRAAIKYHRCVVPADGWYEWKREGGHKQPYFMTDTSGASLAMAGIWARWHGGESEEPLETCAILTTEARGPLRDVHERMPLLLTSEVWQQWLDPELLDVTALLVGTDASLANLELRPVSSRVNNVRNNGIELLERVELAEGLLAPQPVDLDLVAEIGEG